MLIIKKKRTCHLTGFTVPTDHRIKIKESEKINKYLDLGRELKRLQNMRVTVILVVNRDLGIVSKEIGKRVG